MPAAAASARPSTMRTPSRNGPVPRRQTRTRERQRRSRRGGPTSTAVRLMRVPLALEGAAGGPPGTSAGAAGTGSRTPMRTPARTRSSAAAPGRARRGRREPPGGPGRPRSARRRRRRSGRASGTGCTSTSPRLRIGRASSTRRSGAGRPVARPASRHAMAGPSARSTQNRWSSVHTEPCHQIVASTGAAAASASQAHGHDRRAWLAPTMPAASDADREQRGEIGRRLDHERVQVRDVRADDPHRRHDERDGRDHDDGAPPADHQQQQREQAGTAGPRRPSTRTPRWGCARRRCSAPAAR